MKRFALAFAAALVATNAVAADLPPYKAVPAPAPVATYSWTGLYIGLNAGYGNSYDNTSVVGTDTIGGLAVATGIIPGSMDTRADGWLGGGQIGWNWHYGQMLFGVETDLQFADIKGSAGQTLTTAPLGLPITVTASASHTLDWFGTLRARAGFLISDRALFYGTGGLAYGNVDYTASASLTAPGLNALAIGTHNDVQWGWTVGGGIEFALLPNWTIKGEYLYVDLGDVSVAYGTTIAGAGVSFNAAQDLTYHVVRVGLNYRF